ncbi:hypothetical protein TUN199_06143 [Pyrenophora tritici-repentis]|nr:hypothetical protein Alg215_05348 [Pyrenophora tritici-repentis]KAI0581820.1 hypothetical protein Alg130_06409 [Pyrenophora tritici-repentis]KAI0609415.1 hypothetical protein TUN205_06341 [Pyrenophora tritici-repentis]KAI0621868.1 hypothetical protein TUN199_06143 [Pyrenophora tritici-repentis]
MDASTRLYKRLGEIPEDPNDPESLDDLIVCAFGAFERYYVCWKTKGGEFKSDSYDLPPALRDFLYPDPSSGITRDHASLQVVFGRGEEYFASDNNGKLEFKEPAETRKSLPPTSNGGDNDEEGGITNNNTKADRQALRRSRTVSFLRPLSEMSVRSDTSFGIGIRDRAVRRVRRGTGTDIDIENSTDELSIYINDNSAMYMRLPRPRPLLHLNTNLHIHLHINININLPTTQTPPNLHLNLHANHPPTNLNSHPPRRPPHKHLHALQLLVHANPLTWRLQRHIASLDVFLQRLR